MGKFAYITVLSNDLYYPGVKGLFVSLKKTNPRFPFYVLLGKSVSAKVRNDLLAIKGINLIDADSIRVVDAIKRNNEATFNPRWNFTFDKLLIFEQTQFDKLVFLDADMLVLQNLDHLFEKPDMSAVCAGVSYPGNERWEGLNSGIMVVVPKIGFVDELMKLVPKVLSEKVSFGDQDLLQQYYKDWSGKKELDLGEKYNVFSDYLEYYITNFGYGFSQSVKDEKSIAVIHFAGEKKPWIYQKTRFSYLLEQLYYLLCVFLRKHTLKRYQILYYKYSKF